MFKTLLKTRLAAFGAYYSGAGRRRGGKKQAGAGRKVLYALLFLYCFVAFGGMFFGLFSVLAEAFAGTAYAWLYFVMYAIVSFALMFIGSVFTAKTQLFEARDNELLLAMPVPPRYILGSRMAALVIFNAVFQLTVSIPALAAWIIAGHAGAFGICAFVVLLPALNLFTMAVTCLFAWLLSLLTSRMRGKNIMTLIFSVVFLAAYFVVISRMNRYVTALAAHGAQLAQTLGGVSPLVWLGRAMTGESAAALAASLVLLLVPFVLSYALLSRSFIGIVTTKRGAAKIRYREKEMKTATPRAALLRREFARLGSSAGYMLNAGLGVVFCVAGAGLLLFGRGKVIALTGILHITPDVLTALVTGCICYLLCTMVFAASSVSLEGSRLWIVRTAPVTTSEILLAKRRMHLLIVLPAALLPAAASASVLGGRALFAALCTAAFALVTADVGLAENLRHPNLTWLNEMQAVKQGSAVLLTMLILMGLILVPALLYVLVLPDADMRVFLTVLAAVFFALDRLLLRWIKTRGAERFECLD